MIGQILTA